jgi:threonine dehydrogenase-like Zn-dependent dehydrogenase
MKAAVLTKGGFEIGEVERPEPGPREVLVKVSACGICEGDTYQYRRMQRGESFESELGHEGSGIVEAIGKRVGELKEGDRVTAIDGPYGEYFVTRPERLVKLPDGIDLVWAMGEPVACVLHAAPRFGIRLGDRVALLGCGFMGLLCLQAARLAGPSHLCAMDLLDWRLTTAKALGADETLNVEGMSGEDLAKCLGEFDVVIEAVGNQAALDLAWPIVRQHGRIILIGYHQTGQGMRTINMERWNFKAIDVINGHVRRDDEKVEAMRRGLDLMAAGRFQMEPLVTEYDFDHIDEAFEDLIGRKEGLYKVALVP